MLKPEHVRDRAIDTLTTLSLVRNFGQSVSIHPLISLVSRNLEDDPVPRLEIAFGFFFAEMDGMAGFSAMDRHLDHIIRIATTAIDEGLEGPMVIRTLIGLTWRLPSLGSSDTKWGNRWTVEELGRKAVSLSEKAFVDGWLSLGQLTEARRALAQALYLAGRFDEALTLLTDNIHTLKQSSLQEFAISVLDLAHVACDAPEVEYVERALRQLEMLPPIDASLAEEALGVAAMRAHLLRRLGRTDEAHEAMQVAFALTHANDKISPQALEATYSAASLIARDLGLHREVHEYENAALEISRKARGEHPDAQLLRALLSAADGAIEADELSQAKTILTEAEDLAVDKFGADTLMHARVLSTRGRLWLHHAQPKNAYADLSKAIAILRAGTDLDRGLMPASLLHLAMAAYLLRRQDEAIDCANEAYEIDLARFGPDHPETMKDIQTMNILQTPWPPWLRSAED